MLGRLGQGEEGMVGHAGLGVAVKGAVEVQRAVKQG